MTYLSESQEIIYNDIIALITDNLKILISNQDSCLYRFNEMVKLLDETSEDTRIFIDQHLLNIMTEECLYALLNADFLYDFRDIE